MPLNPIEGNPAVQDAQLSVSVLHRWQVHFRLSKNKQKNYQEIQRKLKK